MRGGSQCGYCTPGFVCSMAAEFYREGRCPAGEAEPRRLSIPAGNGHAVPPGREGDEHTRRRPRARPQRLRPARAERQPVPVHRLPAHPRRRLRAGRARRRRPPGGPPRRAAPAPAHTRLTGEGGDFVRPADLAEALRPPRRAPGRPAGRRLHRLGRRGQPARSPPRPGRGRRPAARAARPRLVRRRRGDRRRPQPLGGRAPARRAGAAAGPAVPAVRLPPDPQRRHHRRQPRHGLPDRRHPARPARPRGDRRAGVTAGASARWRSPTTSPATGRACGRPTSSSSRSASRCRSRRSPPSTRSPSAGSTTSPAWRWPMR